MTSFVPYTIFVKDAQGNPLNMLGVDIGTSAAPEVISSSTPFDVLGQPLFYDDNPGIVADALAVVSASFSRPNNTSPYISGTIVGNTQTAGAITPMQFPVMRKLGGTCEITRARLTKSSPSIGNAVFRLHLFRTIPTSITNGDGGTFICSNAADYVGSFTFDMTGNDGRVFGDGAKVIAIPDNGGEKLIVDTPNTSNTIYGLLECRGAYTPTTNETFTPTLEVRQN